MTYLDYWRDDDGFITQAETIPPEVYRDGVIGGMHAGYRHNTLTGLQGWL